MFMDIDVIKTEIIVKQSTYSGSIKTREKVEFLPLLWIHKIVFVFLCKMISIALDNISIIEY